MKKLAALRLRDITLRGRARKDALADVSIEHRRYDLSTWVHAIEPTTKVFRVAEDVLVISDGGSGYIPMTLSGLEKLVKDARELPLTKRIVLP